MNWPVCLTSSAHSAYPSASNRASIRSTNASLSALVSVDGKKTSVSGSPFSSANGSRSASRHRRSSSRFVSMMSNFVMVVRLLHAPCDRGAEFGGATDGARAPAGLLTASGKMARLVADLAVGKGDTERHGESSKVALWLVSVIGILSQAGQQLPLIGGLVYGGRLRQGLFRSAGLPLCGIPVAARGTAGPRRELRRSAGRGCSRPTRSRGGSDPCRRGPRRGCCGR